MVLSNNVDKAICKTEDLVEESGGKAPPPEVAFGRQTEAANLTAF